jgi:hypothetical protein
MTTNLKAGGVVTLNLPAGPGMVLVFKTNRLNIAGGAKETCLDLYNKDEDIVLHLTIRRGQNRLFFNDRAHQSLGDGWGQEKSVDLSPVDVERWHRSGVSILVHNCSTYLGERYQILFDLTTVFYFATRFAGPVITIGYSTISTLFQPRILSDPLEVVSYQLNTLPSRERQAITSGTSVDFQGLFFITHRRLVSLLQVQQ